MFSKSGMLKSFLAAAVFASGLTACVKQRSDRAAFGSGLATGDTVEKSSIDGKTFKLETGETVADGHNTFAQKLTVEDDVDFLNNLSFVSYTTDATLVGPDVLIKGVANNKSDYSIQYKVEGEFLKVYKIGPKKLIPSSEWTYATDLGGGKLAVPLVSYPVTHYITRKAQNEDGRDTNILTEIPITDSEKLGTATHIRVNTINRANFVPLEKQDVFSKEMFLTGEWQFSIEVIDLADDIPGGESLGFIYGGNRGGNGGWNESIKLRFTAEADRLVGENLNIDSRMANKDQNFKETLTLPIKDWFNFKVRDTKTGKELSEVNLQDNSDKTKASHIQVDFPKMKCWCSSDFNQPSGAEAPNFSELIVAKNMISWVLKTKTQTIRYNLLKPDWPTRKFYARAYPDGDDRKFGTLPTFSDYNVTNEAENNVNFVFNNRRLSRLTPGQVVEYHATGEGANEPWVDESAIRATDMWNRVFKHVFKNQVGKDGKPVPPPVITYNPKRVAKGDPRYFKFNFTALNNRDTAGGIGNPSHDASTGQIYSATSHLYIGITNQLATEVVYNYILSQTGVFNASLVIGEDRSINLMRAQSDNAVGNAPSFGGISLIPQFADNKLASATDNWTFAWTPTYTPVGGSFQKNYVENTAAVKYIDVATTLGISQAEVTPEKTIQAFQKMNQDMFGHERMATHNEDVYSASAAGVAYIVENRCPEVKSFIAKNKGTAGLPEISQTVMASCVTEFIKHQMLEMMLHEMGHNFGLQHNFYGSADKANYPDQKFLDTVFGPNYVTLPKDFVISSSIMDYNLYYNPSNAVVGPYDVAAIRYIYTGEVATESGKVINVVTGVDEEAGVEQVVSIDRAGEMAGDPARLYKFCDNSDLYSNKDPLCAQFDYGSSPSEVVQNIIKDYRSFIQLSKLRYDKAFFNSEGGRTNRAVQNYIWKLKRFYDQWRIHAADMVSKQDQYLEKFSVEDWTMRIKAVATNDSPVNANLAEYYNVRNLVFNFFKDEAFRLNYYCIVEVTDKQGAVTRDYFEYSKARDFLRLYVTGVDTAKASSCVHPNIVQMLDIIYKQELPNTEKVAVVGEIGEPLKSYHYSLNPLDMDLPFDVLGVGGIRLNAFLAIVNRSASSIIHINNQFYPNMLDEPDLRQIINDTIVDRVSNGVRIAPIAPFPKFTNDTFVDMYKSTANPLITAGINSQNYLQDPMARVMYSEVIAKAMVAGKIPPTYDNVYYQGTEAILRFDEEKDHIAEIFRLYIQGLPVPGKIDTTITRLLPFMTIAIPSYYGQKTEDMVDMGRYYLQPRPEATVAASFAQRFNSIDKIVNGHIVDPEKLSKYLRVKFRAALLGAQDERKVTPQWEGPTMPPERKLQDLTMGDLMKAAQSISNSIVDENEYTNFEKAIIMDALNRVVNLVADKDLVIDSANQKPVGLGTLIHEKGQLTQIFNQAGTIGDGLNDEQKAQKESVRARLDVVTKLIESCNSHVISEILKDPNDPNAAGAVFDETTMNAVIVQDVLLSNKTQIEKAHLKGELDAQKELIKTIFMSM